jgi:hypothetical protein
MIVIVSSGRLSPSVDHLYELTNGFTPTIGLYKRLQKFDAFVSAMNLRIQEQKDNDDQDTNAKSCINAGIVSRLVLLAKDSRPNDVAVKFLSPKRNGFVYRLQEIKHRIS